VIRFSRRTHWNTEENELSRAHRERLASGLPLADLTESNPTRCGFAYPAGLLTPLSEPAAIDYDPDPKGILSARQAVCSYYAAHGAAVEPRALLLTTSTSEAYSLLFKLLCDPGDAVLAPRPCYPLFDFLADAEVVKLNFASFVYDHGWQLDMESLRARITPNTRALLLVHPNNPTGHFTRLREAEQLAALCRQHRLALIVDEVFLDYAAEDGPNREAADEVAPQIGSGIESGIGSCPAPADRATFAARQLGILIFVVSGISKICALPQMKAAWLAAAGPGSEEALARLEVLADTYLSMNAPVQHALPAWLGQRAEIQAQIRTRIAANLAELDRHLGGREGNGGAGLGGAGLVTRLILEAGWYAVLRIPAFESDEVTARRLLHEGVLVHPGSFFGLGRSGWLVVSLLGRPSEFSTGIGKLVRFLEDSSELPKRGNR